MAATAASALDVEHIDFREHWSTFGPVTAEMKAIEDLSLIGDARGVLSRADEGPLSRKALKKLGRPSANNWDRHRLDVARAHAMLGSHQDAMDELNTIRRATGAARCDPKRARRGPADRPTGERRRLRGSQPGC
ncbi:hypothetical protein [Streptomyces sp. NPDC051644]|uniref:hypothetical protein n=1 Tax=unclassified Streptomyces TaxID=2593676 RepID=UPI0037AD3522